MFSSMVNRATNALAGSHHPRAAMRGHGNEIGQPPLRNVQDALSGLTSIHLGSHPVPQALQLLPLMAQIRFGARWD
jgi:hypothetical protein